jgi:hypothetical protein
MPKRSPIKKRNPKKSPTKKRSPKKSPTKKRSPRMFSTSPLRGKRSASMSSRRPVEEIRSGAATKSGPLRSQISALSRDFGTIKNPFRPRTGFYFDRFDNRVKGRDGKIYVLLRKTIYEGKKSYNRNLNTYKNTFDSDSKYDDFFPITWERCRDQFIENMKKVSEEKYNYFCDNIIEACRRQLASPPVNLRGDYYKYNIDFDSRDGTTVTDMYMCFYPLTKIYSPEKRKNIECNFSPRSSDGHIHIGIDMKERRFFVVGAKVGSARYTRRSKGNYSEDSYVFRGKYCDDDSTKTFDLADMNEESLKSFVKYLMGESLLSHLCFIKKFGKSFKPMAVDLEVYKESYRSINQYIQRELATCFNEINQGEQCEIKK